ncbi:hypothetical protein TNCV_2210251 [Trichonephila clavipes]|nr:hypothetical protein TNCV_2210251 [Trichonephila clavipes]
MTNVFPYLTSIAAYNLEVAIYRKQNSHIWTPHMDITYRQTSGRGAVSHDIGGHICGKMLISKWTNRKFGDRIHFFESNGRFLAFCTFTVYRSSALLKKTIPRFS